MTVDRGGVRGIDVEPGDSERALEELRAAGRHDQLTLLEAVYSSLAAWMGMVARGSEGARLIERDGVRAARCARLRRSAR